MDIHQEFRALEDRYGNGGMSRRAFLGRVGTLACATGIAGSALQAFLNPSGAHAQARTLRYDGFGGAAQRGFTKNVLTPFTNKTGIVVNQGTYGSELDLLTKIAADGPSDYNFFSAANPSTCLLFVDRGYTETLEESKIPRLRNIVAKSVEKFRVPGAPGTIMALPFYVSGVAIAYNRDKVPKEQVEAQGAKILLDPAYKMRIGGEDHWQRRICYAAQQTGQDMNNLTDMPAIWDKIRESKSYVRKFWHSGSEHVQMLSSGEVDLSDAWFASIQALRQQGLAISYYPNNGTYVNFGSLVVVKGTPLDLAYEMLDILLRPEVLIAQALDSANAVLLNPRMFDMPTAAKDLLGFDPDGEMRDFQTLEPLYWNAHADEWQHQYRRIMSR